MVPWGPQKNIDNLRTTNSSLQTTIGRARLAGGETLSIFMALWPINGPFISFISSIYYLGKHPK